MISSAACASGKLARFSAPDDALPPAGELGTATPATAGAGAGVEGAVIVVLAGAAGGAALVFGESAAAAAVIDARDASETCAYVIMNGGGEGGGEGRDAGTLGDAAGDGSETEGACGGGETATAGAVVAAVFGDGPVEA